MTSFHPECRVRGIALDVASNSSRSDCLGRRYGHLFAQDTPMWRVLGTVGRKSCGWFLSVTHTWTNGFTNVISRPSANGAGLPIRGSSRCACVVFFGTKSREEIPHAESGAKRRCGRKRVGTENSARDAEEAVHLGCGLRINTCSAAVFTSRPPPDRT